MNVWMALTLGLIVWLVLSVLLSLLAVGVARREVQRIRDDLEDTTGGGRS